MSHMYRFRVVSLVGLVLGSFSSGCFQGLVTDDYQLSCETTVLSTQDASEIWDAGGFSADDVVDLLAMRSDGPGTSISYPGTGEVELELSFSASLLSREVTVVERSGEEGCSIGTFLALEVERTAQGTIEGYEVVDVDRLMVYAPELSLLKLESEGVSGHVDSPAQVSPELAALLAPYADPNEVWGDPAEWVWRLGAGGIEARAQEDGMDGLFGVLQFEVVPAT